MRTFPNMALRTQKIVQTQKAHLLRLNGCGGEGQRLLVVEEWRGVLVYISQYGAENP